MKLPEDDNWLDDALTKALGAEKSKPNFEKWKKTHREAVETLISRAQQEPSASAHPHKITSIITKSRITKLAAAAVIIIIVGTGVDFLDKSVSPAYAIEQTIEALRGVSTVHVIGTNWDGHRFESWCKVNPKTGRSEWVCIDETPHGNKVASTPKGSCVWDNDGNVIRLTNRIIATNDFRYAQVFEELSNRTNNPSDDEKISIYREKDPVGGEDVIVIWSITKLQDFKVYVDPTTKLPIRIHFDRADNMVQIAKSIDRILYNVELPEGMFDFEIPEECVRDYSVLEDPEKGMPADGLTHEQASILIAKKYWKAAITGDWDSCRQLAPMDESWKTGFRTNPPVELVEVKQPYPERGCTGLIVPCVVRYKNEKVYESKAVVNYREINGRPSCIIVARWGKCRLIE